MGASFCYRCMAPLEKEVNTCPRCKGQLPYISTDSKDIVPGTLVNSRYIIGRCIGRGGFGATYIAHDLLQRNVCAVKEFFPDKMCEREADRITVSPNTQTVEWFNRYKFNFSEEAGRLFELSAHPGVVNVLEQFEANGTAYFSMEYIKGETLKEYMRKFPQGLQPKEAMQIIADLLMALSMVHEAGLLHRDISADNVMRTFKGQIKLIDFGSARDTQKVAKTVFTKGVYTAPEQKLGDKQRPCTDLYAVGVLMFMLMVGRVPNMTDVRMESLRSVKKGLNEETYCVFENATAVNPNYRYKRAVDMLTDLQQAINLLPRPMKTFKYGNLVMSGIEGHSEKMQKLKTYLLLLAMVMLLLLFVLMIISAL